MKHLYLFEALSNKREKINLDINHNGFLYGDRHEEEGERYYLIEKEQVYFDTEKNYVEYKIIIKRESDGKFFKGSAEDWGRDQIEIHSQFEEVYPKEKTIIVYE